MNSPDKNKKQNITQLMQGHYFIPGTSLYR
jgi:hypothetical protein